MSISSVRFKGGKNGLLISLDWERSIAEILAELELQLQGADQFFSGSKVTLEIGQQDVELEDLLRIQDLLARHGIRLHAVRASNWSAVVQMQNKQGAGPQFASASGKTYRGDSEGAEPSGLVVKRTLRSGQVLEHPGSLILVGDVNPGAEVIAGQNVIIWGALRGMACAGTNGDRTAAIYALYMAPSQLRIAECISRPPKEGRVEIGPEVARIEDGKIVVERWNLKRNRKGD